MPEGQVVTLDCCFGSATVTRFLRGSGMPLINTDTDLAILVTAGQDIVLPGPYVEATGPPVPGGPVAQAADFEAPDFSPVDFMTVPTSEPGLPVQPFRMVQPIPQIVVTRPDGVQFVYPAIIIGDRNFQGRQDYPTPIGVVEAGTLARAIMPAADLNQGGTYSAYLQFDTTTTSVNYFLVTEGVFIPPPEPGQFDFRYPDFEPRDFQAGPVP